jgi:predicted  nucleic acid-binding Zn-ribbon protein
MAKEIVSLKQRTSLGTQTETESSLQALQREIAELETSLAQAGVFQPDVIERKIRSVQEQISTLSEKYARLKDGDGLAHSLGLSEEQMAEISRVINPKLFGMSRHHLKESTKGNFKSYLLAHLAPQEGVLERAGFTLNLEGISPLVFELDKLPEIEQQIQLEKANLQTLQKDLAIANDQQGTRLRLSDLKLTAKKLSSSIHDYERLERLEAEYFAQKEDFVTLELQIEDLTQATADYSDKLETLNAKIHSINTNLEVLRRKQKSIREVQEKLSFKVDFFGMAEGDESEFTVDLGEIDFDEVLARLNSLEIAVRSIQGNIKVCQDRIIESLPQLAEHLEDNSLAIKAKERIDALPQTRDWLTRLHEAAIIKVAGSLRDLQDNFLQLEHEITLFNRSISARKVSNLKRFSVELRRNDQIIESIDTLLKNMNSSDFSADLFGDTGEEISNAELKRALERLSRVVENGKDGNLEVADLFEMAFTVVDARGRETTSEKLDDMASNGSSMTLKPLLFMSLIRHLMDKKVKDEPFLPFYLDEAENVDEQNQKVILGYAQDLGFTPVFASVHPTLTGDYGVNLSECVQDDARIVILPEDWHHFVHHDQVLEDEQMELPA